MTKPPGRAKTCRMINATAPETTAPATRQPAPKNSVAIPVVAFMLFLANFANRFPGVTNWDSKEQFAQAVTGHFADWQPPIMAWVWSKLRLIADGSGPLFFLQIFCYWLGFGLIALILHRMNFKRRRGGLSR